MSERIINSHGLEVPIDTQIFLHITSEDFVTPAYEQAGLDIALEDFWPAHAIVYYATQLAIATHRPQEIRDLERSSMKKHIQFTRSEKQRERTKKYGNDLPGNVQFAGVNWKTSLFLDLADSIDSITNAPVHTYEEIKVMRHKDRPLMFRDANTGTLATFLSQESLDCIEEIRAGYRPYDYLKGYHIDKELEKIYGGFNGDTAELARWDRLDGPKPPFDATDEGETIDPITRYEARFKPEFYIWTARQDIVRRIGTLNQSQAEVVDTVANIAVASVIESFASATRTRHASSIKEYDDDAYDELYSDEQVHDTHEGVIQAKTEVKWQPLSIDSGMLAYLDQDMVKGILEDERDNK